MSTENAYRAVRVKVMNEFSDAHISRVLPPEHRVTATAPLSGHNSRELLIEGPMLPPGSEPPIGSSARYRSQAKSDAAWTALVVPRLHLT